MGLEVQEAERFVLSYPRAILSGEWTFHLEGQHPLPKGASDPPLRRSGFQYSVSATTWSITGPGPHVTINWITAYLTLLTV